MTTIDVVTETSTRIALVAQSPGRSCSPVAAFSTSPGMLIASRALLGIAGATLAPSTLSLISNMFVHADQRKVAIGVWATSFSLGSAIGRSWAARCWSTSGGARRSWSPCR